MEEWKVIPGFEDKYEASNLGNIRVFNGRFLAGYSDDDDYKIIRLSIKNGKTKLFKIAQLILITFLGPRPNGCESSHLNDIRNDNRLENLIWETHQENESRKIKGILPGEKHFAAKLSSDAVLKIREMRAKGINRKQIAPMFGINDRTVDKIFRREKWKHI